MRFLALAFAALLAPVAHAQVLEVYGTFSPTHVSNVVTGSYATNTGYALRYASFWAPAVGGGVTLNFLPLGPLKLGFDLRGSTKPGTTGVDTALFGLKLGVKAPLVPVRPYVQLSGGYVATRSDNLTSTGTQILGGTFTNKYAAFEGIAGLDYHLLPFINLRVIELGAGKGYNTGITLGSATNGGEDMTFFTLNTGVVLHF